MAPKTILFIFYFVFRLFIVMISFPLFKMQIYNE